MSSEAVWQEVEYGSYAADLAVWERLVASHGAPVLELGCGCGRVALHLARQGHEVWAVDDNERLVTGLAEQAAVERLALRAICADVGAMKLDHAFPLAIAPMQLMQVLGGREKRAAALRRVLSHLVPGGALAAAVVDAGAIDGAVPPPLPDVRELDGWVYSSLPVAAEVRGDRLEVRRIRQTVSPDGSLVEADHTEYLDLLDAGALEAEAAAAGFRPAGRLAIPPEDGYVGSTVVIVERR